MAAVRSLGNIVDIAPGVRILTEQHNRFTGLRDGNVVIRSRRDRFVRLLLPGTFGEGAVVAAGSVVVENVPAYSMAAGNPAVPKRERKRDIQYRLDFRRPFH